jgi:3-dehydroquinate dehydratase
MTKLIVSFHNFANTPKKSIFSVKQNTYFIEGYRVSLNKIHVVFD